MRLLMVALLCLGSVLAHAREVRVAIIIDDLGHDQASAQQVLELPTGVTVSILPRLGYSGKIAEQAFAQGREVMLHQPMQPLFAHNLGPGALTLMDTRGDMNATLWANIGSVPHVSGINNHMGSLLTRNRDSMRMLMQMLQDHGGLYYVDSRTDSATVAQSEAEEHGLPNARRDVFLDNLQDPEYVREQLQRVLRLAQQRGSAIAIGHPYPETLAVLHEVLPDWQQQGVALLPVSQVIEYQRSPQSWHASSSRSPKVAKNSKQ